MIEASNVSFSFGDHQVLTEVSLRAHTGEVVGIIGPNGSGKSTLLRTLYGALKPSSGSIQIDGVPLASIPLAARARRIGVVAQESPSEIPLTVAEMVLLGRSPHRKSFERYTADDRALAIEAMRRVEVEGIARANYAQISGGEKRRVLIARALAQNTDHLLLDEPTNHLDIRHQHGVLLCVRSLGITTVVVLHDLNLAARYCDRIVLVCDGKVVADGTPNEVLTPELIEPIYGIRVRRIDEPDCVQLVFRPESPIPAFRSTTQPKGNNPQ
ncbi:ABC transporter ATP-binding protein [Bifidobacterium tibiigranuli]|jgi:iron complex transport system ATP-binding protein|uniref:ABC transporter ATP-binding protein n=1 Tax=Bifidobacterium tibiigranuli TaxID=2172043 RepID=UPI00235515EA|nr:ABC transporter ATP-binding protein [Bifidobacterium tibiigranuli]MCH3973564.1 ABC transporter ATP-binding protein [Bifidobacterium tibiigranuli]MCI1650409.1 ABC transporter ATP-binding protein [Bifidobacterium tibiigranuli]MCI2184906.1 ABC transporter ATP-binding protein [Bifidobacterium tibiigranuli]MCI2204855.1 ABC transporter ATP-binding protein [Bifidobacterium tibiigranuli]